METVAACKEALRVSQAIAALDIPMDARMELTEAITSFARCARQEGYVDGLHRAAEILEAQKV